MPEFRHRQTSVHYRWVDSRRAGDDSAPVDSAPVLVLSHSLGSDSAMWQPQRDALAGQFRILLYDHPGHGQSAARPASESPVPIARYGEELLALLDHVEIPRVHFCGLSLGGMVGQWLGANAPERLDRLVISNTAAVIEEKELLRARIDQIRSEGLSSIVENVIEKWFSPAHRSARPESCRLAREMLSRTTAAAYADTAETVCALDLRPSLPKIRVPTLVIGGSEDDATPPQWNRAIAEQIPGARWRLLPAAHLSNIEAAAEFNAALLQFLR